MNFKQLPAILNNFLLIIICISIISCDTSVDDRTQEIEPQQIKIGLLAPLTGPLAGVGQDFEGTARMAAQEINIAGGVNGQEIGFLVRDTRLGLDDSAEVSDLMAQQLIDEGVVAIIGPAGSGTTLSISSTTIARGVPIISPSATSPALSLLDDNDLIWRSVASDAFQGRFLAEQLIADQHTSISIIYRDDAYGNGLQQTIAERFSELGGSVLTSVSYPADKTSNFDAEVNALFSNETADAFVVISFLIDGANIMVSLANSGYDIPQLYGVDGNNRSEFIVNSPPQVVLGMRGSAPTAPSSSPNYQAFTRSYQNIFGSSPTTFTESVYDAVYLLALAMSVGNENSESAIVNNLRDLSKADTSMPLTINVGPDGYRIALQNLTADLDLEGAASAIDFDENGDVTSGNYIFWEIVQQDGELVFQVLEESSFP